MNLICSAHVHLELPLEHINDLIKAEIPKDNLHLCDKIKKYMMHSHDHLTRENSHCRKGNTCTYGFPHPITSEMWIDDEGRVHFRWPEEEDRWIASHIPEIIDNLDCHIHIDVTFTVSMFMYLYKYIFKGPLFWVRCNDSDNIDEIADYVNGRYLSAPESAWHIPAFDITSKEPSITCLPVHLPRQNTPQFVQGTAHHESSASLLICYFNQPREPQFVNLPYTEYFQQYLLYKWDPQIPLLDDEFLERVILGTDRRKVCPRCVGEKVS